MNKKKILSALALAGVLTAGFYGANVKASVESLGTYTQIVKGKNLATYQLLDSNSKLTLSDIRKQYNVSSFNGTEENKVKTADTFVANNKEYTVVLYGDVNKDGDVDGVDVRTIKKYILNSEKNPLDAVQLEAADIDDTNENSVDGVDVRQLKKFILNNPNKQTITTKPTPEDTEAPVITISEEKIYVKSEADYNEKMANITIEANDNVDENIQPVVSGTVDFATDGEYVLTYSATDTAGNSAETKTLTVVVDTTNPVFDNLPDTISAKSYDEIEAPTVTAGDDTVTSNISDDRTTVTYTAVDKAGNETVSDPIPVVVDETAPELELSKSTVAITKGPVTVTIVANEKIQPVEDWTLSADGLTLTRDFDTNVEPTTVTVMDLAGNTASVDFRIDNIDSEVSLVKQDGDIYYKLDHQNTTSNDVVVTIEASEEVTVEDTTWQIARKGTDNHYIIEKRFEENTPEGYKVTIKDSLGNSRDVEVVVSNIDKTGPVATNVVYSPLAKTNGDVTLTISADEEIGKIKVGDGLAANVTGNATIISKKEEALADPTKVAGTVVYPDATWTYLTTSEENEDGTYTAVIDKTKVVFVFNSDNVAYKDKTTEQNIVLKDLYGNDSEVIPIKVDNIDTILNVPTVTYSPELGNTTKGPVTVTITADEEIQVPSGWTLNAGSKSISKVFTRNENEDVTVKDIAGNEKVANVKVTNIDNEAPIVYVAKNGAAIADATEIEDVTEVIYAQNVKFKFNEGTAILDGTSYTAETLIEVADGSVEEHQLVVTDNVGNKTTINFVLDKEKPIFNNRVVESVDVNTGEITYNNLKLATKYFVKDDIVDLSEQASDATSPSTIVPTYTISDGTTVVNEEDMVTDGTITEKTYDVTYTAKDAAGNEATIHKDVVIDTVAPTISLSLNTSETVNSVVVVLTSNEELQPIEGWTLSENKLSANKEVTEKGVISVTVKDLAGNETTKSIDIQNVDNVIPSVSVEETYTDNGAAYNGSATNRDIKAVITSSKEIPSKPAGWSYRTKTVDGAEVEDKTKITKTYTAGTTLQNDEEVTIVDIAGNTTTALVKLNVLKDNIVATFSAAANVNIKTEQVGATNGNVKVSVTGIKYSTDANTTELVYTLPTGWSYGTKTVDGVEVEDKTKITKIFEENTTAENNTVDIKDQYGNTKTVTVSVVNIDKTAPVFEGTQPNVTNYSTLSLTVTDSNLKTVKINGVLVDDLGDANTYTKTFNIEGTYTVEAEDDFGLKSTVTFTIDKTAPTLTATATEIKDGVETAKAYADNGKYYGVTLTFDEGTLILNNGTTDSIIDTSPCKITEDGTYTATLKDAAGNASATTFKVDRTAPVLKNKVTTTNEDDGDEVINYIDISGSYAKEKLVLVNNPEDATTVSYDIKKIDTTAITPENPRGLVDTVVNTDYALSIGEYTFKGISGASTVYVVTATDEVGNKTTVEFTIDDKAPTVSLNGKTATTYYYNTSVTPSADEDVTYTLTKAVEDDPAITAVENKVNVPYTSGAISGDGVYTLVATDALGNHTDTTFKILTDRTKPTITIVETPHNGYYQTATLTFADAGDAISATETREASGFDKVLVNGEDKTSSRETDGSLVISKAKGFADGEYTVVAYDKAGNASEAKVINLVNTKPTLTVKYSNKSGETFNPAQSVIVTITSDYDLESVTSDGDYVWTINASNKKVATTTVTSNSGDIATLDINNIEGTAITGLKSEKKTVTVQKIDVTAPTVVENSAVDGPTEGKYTVTITASEAIVTPEGWTKVTGTDEKKITKEYTLGETARTEKIKITDIAGNESAEISFNIPAIE